MRTGDTLDEFPAPCVRCGWCCSKRPCPYGKAASPDGTGCVHLTADRLCAIHDEIAADPNSAWSPAFGAGCSSTMFNTVREAKILRDRERSRT